MSKATRYDPTTKGKRPFKLKRGNFLYIFLAPLFLAVILALLARDIAAFVLNIIAFGLFFATAKLNTLSLSKEYEYHSTTLTKAPKPYKTMTAGLLGLSTLYTAWIAGGESLITGLFLGAIATIGYFLYYGFDPKHDKLDNIGDISAEFVIETLAEAREKLTVIEEKIRHIKEHELHSKLRIATDKAYEILNNIEADPKDLRVARKFIIVYIDGIKKVTQSYTDMEESEITNDTKNKFSMLLSDVETRFDKEILRLKKNNQFDLDVHIDVLKEQIKH
ncbi:5-bromo-4-chloroindolyl phosphate hydrolysis family protein [bacterium]|nr:5-bromo-4-chloroindolyl phosphate hydrolysis family protein [bacterium]MBU1959455.1 5-bromo-4-chloroindolyl phosphate hydrolysis family protein [bacterium]